jgi:hypothetical protein
MAASTVLPIITSTPTRYPTCCASISTALLDLLDSVLPQPPRLTFSIGSGTGLLEALFLRQYPRRDDCFLGVDVTSDPPVNRFLPEKNASTVPGSWGVAKEADNALGLVFVYPRVPRLIAEYLRVATGLVTVVWIGPRCDEEEFTRDLRQWGAETTRSCDGIVEEGEMVLVFKRHQGCVILG